MTRFARAHGSKASNERLPEAATSWNVMKQQLKDKLQSSDALADSATSSQKIWKSSDFDRDVWNKNEVKWADLDDGERADKLVKKNKKRKHDKTIPNEHFAESSRDNQKKRKKTNINSAEFHDTQSTEVEFVMADDNLPHSSNPGKMKSKKKKKGPNDEVSETNNIKLGKQTVFVTNNTEHKKCLTDKQKRKQWQRTDIVTCDLSEDKICDEFTVENNMKKKLGKKRRRNNDSTSSIQDKQPPIKLNRKGKVNLKMCVTAEESDHQLKKKHKRSKNENTIEDSDSLNYVKQNYPEEDNETVPGADADAVPNEKHKKKNRDNKTVDDGDISLNGGKLSFQLEGSGTLATVTSGFTEKKVKEKKTKDLWQQENNQKFMKKRKFPVKDRSMWGKSEKKYLQTTILHMNGKDIEIVKFDGFPVKKEDAENLRQLKKKMIANGIPASEIKATMKLERRKAEKALAREKKKVCFHCRNSGHVLSECPELGKADAEDTIGTGICFKCGSTEHKHFECRVTREQEFRYAKCFICNEQGHIARQCPDNPRGLYPKGGGCHVCGDVTHLKKDCPDLIKEKEEKVIKLQTLSNEALEALEDDKNTKSVSLKHVNKKKTVKF